MNRFYRSDHLEHIFSDSWPIFPFSAFLPMAKSKRMVLGMISVEVGTVSKFLDFLSFRASVTRNIIQLSNAKKIMSLFPHLWRLKRFGVRLRNSSNYSFTWCSDMKYIHWQLHFTEWSLTSINGHSFSHFIVHLLLRTFVFRASWQLKLTLELHSVLQCIVG